jgi:MFS family permease
MALCTLATAIAAFLGETTPLPVLLLVLVVVGLGFGFFSTPNTTAIMASIDKKYYGIASSMIATMRTLGMLAAMTLITVLLALFLGNRPVTLETGTLFLDTMRTAMIVFTLLGLAGIFCSIGRTRFGPNQQPQE